MPTFIETQFPIARLSAESYKERKAGASQTLTGLGKWWGRKPLVLVRASILGMLMPASNDAKKDREIFLKILTMDDEGTWQRCKPAAQRRPNGARMFTSSGLAASLLAPIQGAESDAAALPARRGRAGTAGPHPFAASPLRHLMFAIRETRAADNSPEPGRQYLRDTFGQGYWGKREGFVGLLEWLAALGNAEGMNEWIADSEAARILAGRLRNDHA